MPTSRPLLGSGSLLLVAAVLLSGVPAAAEPVVAILPVRSSDPALAASAEESLRSAFIGGGYLIVAGVPVSAAMGQIGLGEITSVEEGRRLGQALEHGGNSRLRTAVIGVACISPDKDYAHGLLMKVVESVDRRRLDAELVDYEMELID